MNDTTAVTSNERGSRTDAAMNERGSRTDAATRDSRRSDAALIPPVYSAFPARRSTGAVAMGMI